MNVSEARAVLKLMGLKLVIWGEVVSTKTSAIQTILHGQSWTQHGGSFELSAVYFEVTPDVPGAEDWPNGPVERKDLYRDSPMHSSMKDAKEGFLAWVEGGMHKDNSFAEDGI